MDDGLHASEKSKYERVWRHAVYANKSPGEREAPYFHEAIWSTRGVPHKFSVIDFGSGTGRGAMALHELGWNAVCVDFARNANTAILPFYEACLWDLPLELRRAHWGFCCDVMEHIPPEKVLDVLRAIRSKVEFGCWFKIAVVNDRMGPQLIGEPLHLCVRAPSWWMSVISLCGFDIKQVINRSKGTIVIDARASFD